MSTTLDSESKARQEVYRIKKKMEGEMNDLQVKFAHTTRQHAESVKAYKNSQTHVKVDS